MLPRFIVLCLLIAGAIYGVLYLITSTRYFKDKARVRQLLKVSALVIATAVLTIIAIASISLVEHSI